MQSAGKEGNDGLCCVQLPWGVLGRHGLGDCAQPSMRVLCQQERLVRHYFEPGSVELWEAEDGSFSQRGAVWQARQAESWLPWALAHCVPVHLVLGMY